MDKTMQNLLLEVLQKEGPLGKSFIEDRTRNSHMLDFKSLYELGKNYNEYRPLKMNDKYKHALLNCLAAQNGTGGMLIGELSSGLKEKKDVLSGNNTISESLEDDAANDIGRFLGYKYPKGKCDEMVSKYIKQK